VEPAEEEIVIEKPGGPEGGEVECPECGEKVPLGTTVCPTCGHRFSGQGVAESQAPEDSLLDDLQRALGGEARPPPPPLNPEVPKDVVDKKRTLLTFLLRIPGVSRRAAEAISGFFQDLEQINLSEQADLARIPGVAPAEARLIREALDRDIVPPSPAHDAVEEGPAAGLPLAADPEFVEEGDQVESEVVPSEYDEVAEPAERSTEPRSRRAPARRSGIGRLFGMLPTLVLFVLGMLGLLLAILVILAYGGIRVAAFRAMWVPWPPDPVKAVVGVLALLVFVWYRFFRRGRLARDKGSADA